MPETERVLWNFIHATSLMIAASAGRLPIDEAKEVATLAIRDMAAAIDGRGMAGK